MKNKIRIGFIGAGFISQLVHLPCFYFDPRVNIVSISEKQIDLLDKVSRKYNIKKKYLCHKEMLKKEKLDGVISVVNRFENFKVSQDVLNHRVSLLAEKPISFSYSDAKKLSEIAKKKRVKFIISYMKRCDDGVQYLKKILNTNKYKLGKLISADYQAFGGDSYSNPFEYYKHKKGYAKKNSLKGNFNNKKILYIKYLNNHCHHINLLRYLFGELRIIYKSFNSQAEGLVLLKNANDAPITFRNQFSNAKEWTENLELFFQNGKIDLKFPTPLLKNIPAKIKVTNYSGKILIPHISWGWSFRNQAKLFVDQILNKNTKNKILCSSRDSVNDIKLIENFFKK